MATKTKGKSKEKPAKTGITGRQVATAAAVVAGVAAVGAGIFFVREKTAEKPDYATVATDGDFEIRDYPELIVASTVVTGVADRKKAIDEGFRHLADYIFAKSRDGEKIAMTAPVLSDRHAATALLDDGVEDGWRTRFVMPAAYTRETLPPAPADVTIEELPARRVAAVAFSGIGSDSTLQKKESELRVWLETRGETATGQVEYAFYDAPIIPGPLRRNEVLIPLG